MSGERLRIGFIPLCDAAALLVAADRGFSLARMERAVALHRRGVYLAAGGAYEPAVAAYAEARRELVPALANGAGRDVPAAAAQGRDLLAALDANTAAALNNLGGRRLEAGDLAGAEAVLRRAAALAPNAAGVYGNLGLCLLERATRARQEGRAADVPSLLAASRDAFTRALALAGPAARPEETAFYRRGLDLTAASPGKPSL